MASLPASLAPAETPALVNTGIFPARPMQTAGNPMRSQCRLLALSAHTLFLAANAKQARYLVGKARYCALPKLSKNTS